MGVSQGERAQYPELIEMAHEGMRAQVNPLGAHLETCTLTPDVGGQIDLLFPREALVEGDGAKDDGGGAFFCSPFFGLNPGIDGVANEWPHGWARRERWNPIGGPYMADGSVSKTELLHMADGREFGPYEGLESYIVYELGTSAEDGAPQLTCALTCTNYGRQSMPLAPGLRSYFPQQLGTALAEFSASDASGLWARIRLDRADLAGASTIDRYKNAMQFVAAGRQITILTQGLEHWIGWTRAASQYMCINPTVMGAPPDNNESQEHSSMPQLGVGKQRTYTARIEWRRVSSAGGV